MLIRAIDLWKTYCVGTEEIDALQGVSFEIQLHEYVVIKGPSGSGKSTLMNLIGCLDTPSRGQYYFHDRLISDLSENELAYSRNAEIGFVFQTFNLLAGATALRNVELPLIYAGKPAAERKERASNVLEQMGLGNRINHRPSELSGGQQQRVAIARALVNNPSILLADEPTGNLDSRTAQDIMTLFERLAQQGNTIVLVTHDTAIAHHAHRILHLRDGRIERNEIGKPIQQAGEEAPKIEIKSPPFPDILRTPPSWRRRLRQRWRRIRRQK